LGYFKFLAVPDSFISYIIFLLIQLGTLFENVFVDSLFTKNLPKDIRGILNGLYYFFGGVGMLLFSKLCLHFYDKFGHESPFFLCATFDLSFVALVIVLSLCGKL
jgi:MFS family permease